MQKIILTLLAALLLGLSACATAPTSASELESTKSATQIAAIVSQSLTAAAPTPVTTTATPANPVALNTSYENAVSVEMQLLAGIFKLEGTDQAVTQTQAQSLLPLWMNLQTLSQSLRPARGGAGPGQANASLPADTAGAETEAQLEAVGQQIQSTLTPEQIRAIAELKITQDSAQTILQEQGLTLVNGRGNGGNGGQPPAGTPQAGGPNGVGQPPADGQPPSGNLPGAASFLPAEWIEALLQLLQSKIG